MWGRFDGGERSNGIFAMLPERRKYSRNENLIRDLYLDPLHSISPGELPGLLEPLREKNKPESLLNIARLVEPGQ